MPTSTIWRQSAGNSSVRGVSPVRPSDDAIERISPEPSFPPTFSDTAYLTSSNYRNQDSIQGLGLSHTGVLDRLNAPQQPEQLYIDRSGGAHVRSRASDARSRQQHHQSSSQDWSGRTPKQNRTYRSNKNKSHTRSGSTIDDLASAAIATSPTFANGNPHSYFLNGSPTTYSPTRPSTSHIPYFGFDSPYEPPAKRVKSERLPAVEWNSHTTRPTTGYHQPTSRSEDAELLLSLRTEVNFTKQASPPMSSTQLYQSPTRFQQAFSPPIPPGTPSREPESSNTQVDTDMHSSQITPVVHGTEPAVNGISVQESTTADEVIDKMEVETASPEAPVLKPTLDSTERDAVPAPEPVIEVKKTRRIKPVLQAEVCAECGKFQHETDDDDTQISWICCNACNRWFHANCVGFKGKSEARSVDKFVCKRCEPEHGQTTFVRTSSRARTAIDYAGLNQGLVKSSIETSMHHYIQPIKTGKLVIQPDDFARITPELLTVEFMESFDNMKRPFVVPACWNPRFGDSREPETKTEEEEGQTAEKRYDSTGTQLDSDTRIPTEIGAEPVMDCDQDLLDMVMPRDLTVRKVAELYGSQELVPVIDVKTQETKGTWTLEQWADYYELPGDKPIRNVISLEVSESRIGRLIRRPKVVRDLDLEDAVWDAEARANQKKRPVQYYCLMSVADSYTDFHIDFGGSSVYYHILKGTKTFFFIPPEDRYLKKYEEWCNSQDQNDTWLPDLCNGNVTRVDLHEGDTAFIPAGWIHSVWTPEDSLVIGGNFLTRIDYDLQLKVANVEKVTKVAPKFRYPFFQKVMWYTLLKYLEEDPVPDDVLEDFQDDPDYIFLRANPVWHEIGDFANEAEPGSPNYNARYYPKSEIKGLPPLRDYLYRTARIYADLPVPDINKKQIEAVKNSIPKGHGDPLQLIKTFAIWCAWKLGGVTTPEWLHSEEGGVSETEKKVKKAETVRLPGERSSQRRVPPRESTGLAVITPYKPGFNAAGVNSDPAKKGRPASHKPSGVRTACDACRKKRVRCPHKEGTISPSAANSTPLSRSQSPAFTPSVNGIATDKTTVIAPMPDRLPSLDTDDGTIYVSSNLAHAALASMDPNSNDANGPLLNGVAPLSGKKSRSKACEECRKSKVSICFGLQGLNTDVSSDVVYMMSMVVSIQPKQRNRRSQEGPRIPSGPHGPVMRTCRRRGLRLMATQMATSVGRQITLMP